jgi:predicted amidohydrolase YtcJ
MAEFLGADPAAREIALKAISLYPAMAMFMENEIGSLDVGKEANFVELNGNLIKAPSEILNDIKVQRTYIRGKMEYHY